jgi:rhamnosyltransferase
MGASNRDTSVLPRIVVLLATFNGWRWLPAQVASILSQTGVRVRIIALDDGSTDGTVEWIEEIADNDPQLSLLRLDGRAGSAGANFYRLVANATVDDDEFVAFADQDDIWVEGKLARHAQLLREVGCDGVSSDVTSFTPRGKRTLVRKAFPQREYDYLMESPGPGSTFLLTPRLFALARQVLADPAGPAHSVDFHDSLIYAIGRARGWAWCIDDVPSVDYRQHDDNVMGSNVGWRSALERLRLIRTHWLRDHTTLLTRVALAVAPATARPGLEQILQRLTGHGARNRWALARLAPRMRRRPRDQRIIGFLIAIGIW